MLTFISQNFSFHIPNLRVFYYISEMLVDPNLHLERKRAAQRVAELMES